ncbi:MAG: exodeoxyribonuclease VII large subunit [Acidimicrobiales bacterium]
MRDPLSVGEVCEGIREALRDQFGAEVWVHGAISGLNRSANGHVYFTLIDPEDVGQRPSAVLDVALFAKSKFRVNAILKKTGSVRMEDGIEVAIGGSIDLYSPSGRVQMIMNIIDPSYTLGRLAQSREATLKRLAAEDLLNRNRLLPLPVLPLRIGLVTSEGSAAEADFMDELSASGITFEVSLFDSRVQGTDAPASLSRAIEAAGSLDLDVVAVVRGGGAKTDLVTFDHFDVAAAVARSGVPVILGVGHEIDRSICDEVAAISAKTPTAAAGWIIQQVFRFDQRVDSATVRLARAASNQMSLARQRCDTSTRRLLAGTSATLAAASRQHSRSANRLASSATASLVKAQHRLDRSELRRAALDPANLMARGWTITRDHRGSIVSSVSQVEIGDVLTTQTADGSITSAVTATEPSHEGANR